MFVFTFSFYTTQILQTEGPYCFLEIGFAHCDH